VYEVLIGVYAEGYTDITVDVETVVGFTSHFANFVLLFATSYWTTTWVAKCVPVPWSHYHTMC